MPTLKVAVPDELLTLMGSREATREHLRRSAILDLVKRHTISQGRGAELLDMSLWAFRALMADADVPVVDLTEAEVTDLVPAEPPVDDDEKPAEE